MIDKELQEATDEYLTMLRVWADQTTKLFRESDEAKKKLLEQLGGITKLIEEKIEHGNN